MMAPVPSALFHSPWLSALSRRTRDAVAAAARTRCFDDGESVYRQGDAADGLHAVASGAVRLVSASLDGAAHVLLLARPGDWFGEIATLDGDPQQQDALSEGRSTLLRVPLADIERIAATDAGLWRAVGKLASLHQRAAIGYFQSIMPLSTDDRVFALLQFLGDQNPGGPLRVTHEEVASSIGATRQTVTAALNRLEERGVVRLGYRSITPIAEFRSPFAQMFRRSGSVATPCPTGIVHQELPQ